MIKSKRLISQVDRPGPDTQERSEIYRLEKNERTTLFSDEEFNAMMKSITAFDLVAYGELEPFYKVVVSNLGIERNNILITAGSDIAIKSVFETFINEGDEVINYHPNYAMFSVYSKMFGAKEIQKTYNKDLVIDIDDLLNSINSSTRMVVISNPGHNGVTISEKNILAVLEKTKDTQTIVLVDEAYVDFSAVDMLKHINTYKNLLIVRTMSKAYGIASVRIGFVLGCKEIIAEVYRVKPVHEIDGIAAKIGTYLFENPSIKNKYVEDVIAGREFLYKRLAEMGMIVLKSDTNFVYFNLNCDVDPHLIYEKLKLKNIYIKNPFKGAPFDNFLRTTVGNPEQMDFFCNELAETLSQYKK
jgi:histidinol-phosphate aminotransferase